MQGVTIKFEIMCLCYKKFCCNNFKYFNDYFDVIIYVVAIKNLLLQISCSNRLSFHQFYCNILQIIDKNNLDQVIAMISSL